MKFVDVEQEEYDERAVPRILRHAVKTLNEGLEIAPIPMSVLVAFGVPLEGKALQGLLDHPRIIVGDEGRYGAEGTLSVLGLLNAVLMTDEFRLTAYLDDDEEIARFGITRVVQEERGEEEKKLTTYEGLRPLLLFVQERLLLEGPSAADQLVSMLEVEQQNGLGELTDDLLRRLTAFRRRTHAGRFAICRRFFREMEPKKKAPVR